MAVLWSAQAMGADAFSGPTTATGASAGINPAAFAGTDRSLSAMAELGITYAVISYQREASGGLNPAVYAPVEFHAWLPDLPFSISIPTPWSSLNALVGGFFLATGGAQWPADGPQRYYSASSVLYAYSLDAGLLYSPSPDWGVALTAGPAFYYTSQHLAVDLGARLNDYLGAVTVAPENPALEGWSAANAWTVAPAAVLGVWAAPGDSLHVGVGCILPAQPTLRGTVKTTLPAVVPRSLASLAPEGAIAIQYPMPWSVNLEADFFSKRWKFLPGLTYTHSRTQQATIANVTTAQPSLVEGTSPAIIAYHDSWTTSFGVAYVSELDWEVWARASYHHIAIPTEAVSPINMDFTYYALSLGVRWKLSEQRRLALTFIPTYLLPVHVTSSIYNSYAPASSGLQYPAATGWYRAAATQFYVSFEGI